MPVDGKKLGTGPQEIHHVRQTNQAPRLIQSSIDSAHQIEILGDIHSKTHFGMSQLSGRRGFLSATSARDLIEIWRHVLAMMGLNTFSPGTLERTRLDDFYGSPQRQTFHMRVLSPCD